MTRLTDILEMIGVFADFQIFDINDVTYTDEFETDMLDHTRALSSVTYVEGGSEWTLIKPYLYCEVKKLMICDNGEVSYLAIIIDAKDKTR